MAKKKSNKPFWKKINLKDERWTKVLGLFTLFFSIILLISMISYLFTWRYDQDKVLTFSSNIFFQKDLEVTNTLGRLGAFLSHQVIYWSFGLPAFILVYITLMYTWKWIRNAKYSLTLKTFNALWLMLYSSVFMESILGRFAFPFGGAIGEWIAFYLRNMLGLAGLLGLLLLVLAILFFWNYNPDLSGLQIPSFQLAGAGGDHTKYNLRRNPIQTIFNFFRSAETPVQSDEQVVDPETEISVNPKRNTINLDFDDPVEETLFSEPTTELDIYKPQYADLNDLRNEPVLEFEDLKPVSSVDSD